ncbi:uncharacterized protein LOC143451520 [Clavelina lepadiformis]|uniref:uncharacterized protein LOC143451520 n=1 Tax=Clavelina lepadiformis TaxID=159417 RepID=UPI00404289ED
MSCEEPYSMESLTMMVLNELKSINKNVTNGLHSLQNEMTAFQRDIKEEIRSLIKKMEEKIQETSHSNIVDVNGFPGESMVGQSPCDVVAYEESVFCESGWDNDEETKEEEFILTSIEEHESSDEESEMVNWIVKEPKTRRQNVKVKRAKKGKLKRDSSKTLLTFCKICQRSFHLKRLFKRHMQLAHMEERPFHCPHCVSKFRRIDHLNAHILIHTGEKPFSCEICGRGFKTKSDMKRHCQIHTKHDVYVCEVCEAKFTFKSALQRHMKTEH